MQSLSAFNVKGFHAGRAHMCKTTQKKIKRKEKRSSLAGRAKMESQWIVELTSSGRVDAVKKGPFPLIIYFPIRHCPARGKNTFICGTLFCEPSNQEPVHSSIVSIVGVRGKSIGRGCHCMCVRAYVCLCVWKEQKMCYFHVQWSKRLCLGFIFLYSCTRVLLTDG